MKPFKTLIRTGAVALSLVACLGAGQAAAAFRVVGYFPTWAGDVNSIRYDRLTHIDYAFLLPNGDGSLQPLSGGSGRLQNLVRKAHANGVKVLISVGGWNDGNDSAFVSLAANGGSRSRFVNNLVNFVNQYGLDGVDIDWEYPEAGSQARNYHSLMGELSGAMHSRGKLLTAAVTARDFPGSVDSGVINAVDFLNLMVYDQGNPHSSYTAAQNALSHWKYNEGLPADKAVLGVPFYSSVNYTPYKTIISWYGSGAAQSDTYGGQDYNGQPTMRAKAELALSEGSGVMIWEITQDTTDSTSLLQTIWDVVGAAAQGGGGSTGGGNTNSGGGSGVSDWRADANYSEGDIVRYNGQLYIAVHANPGYDPTISTWFWDAYNGGAASGAPVQNGATYKIIVKHSGKALDVAGVSSSNGADVHQWRYVGGNNQKWIAVDQGSGYWSLRSVHSGKCLDVDGWGTANGTNIQQWRCTGGTNQQFMLQDQGGGYYNLRARHSNKCVDVSEVSANNGATVHQWACQGQDNAKWSFQPAN